MAGSNRVSRLSTIFLSAAVVGSVVACGTIQTAPQRGAASVDAKSILPVPGGRGSNEDAGVVLAYEFRGAKEGTACRLRLNNTATKKSYFLTLKADANAAYAGLPPGRYETGRLGCGLTKVWEISDLYKNGFQVDPGSASYIGKIALEFDKKDLNEVKKATRAEAANAFSVASNVVPNGMNLVSGFTLAPLTADMASEGATTQGFDVKGQGISGAALEGLLARLQTCDRDAASRDPLRFGRLDYTAKYKDGRFEDFKERRDANAFAEELKTCVAESLSGFRPLEKREVEIRVVY